MGKPVRMMLFAEFLDDFRAGRRLVAKGLAANGTLEFLHQIAREAVFVNRKSLVEPDAGHFPVAGGGVFARRDGDSLPEGSGGMSRHVEMGERFDVCEAEAHEIRQMQRP